MGSLSATHELDQSNQIAQSRRGREASWGVPMLPLARQDKGQSLTLEYNNNILSACPATIPIRLSTEDKSFISVTEEINKAIKATARTITKTKLSDKIRSEDVLQRANLKCLNEAVASVMALTVWKSKISMNPLGQYLFKEKSCLKSTRFQNSKEIRPPVPGHDTLACNIMAKVWNSVPELHNASSQGTAREISRKWTKTLPR